MVLRTVEEQEVSMDELVLEQLVTWVKKLKEVGVSPDKAVEVAQNFMLPPWPSPAKKKAKTTTSKTTTKTKSALS